MGEIIILVLSFILYLLIIFYLSRRLRSVPENLKTAKPDRVLEATEEGKEKFRKLFRGTISFFVLNFFFSSTIIIIRLLSSNPGIHLSSDRVLPIIFLIFLFTALVTISLFRSGPFKIYWFFGLPPQVLKWSLTDIIKYEFRYRRFNRYIGLLFVSFVTLLLIDFLLLLPILF